MPMTLKHSCCYHFVEHIQTTALWNFKTEGAEAANCATPRTVGILRGYPDGGGIVSFKLHQVMR